MTEEAEENIILSFGVKHYKKKRVQMSPEEGSDSNPIRGASVWSWDDLRVSARGVLC